MSSVFAMTEIDRRLGNIAIIGVVEEADYDAATARLRVGDLLTGPLAMGFTRAGPDRDYHPYEIGEQVVALCPSGEPTNGVIIAAINSDAHPPAHASADMRAIDFSDGAKVSYDRAAQHMIVDLQGGTLEVIASGGIAITGDITLTGKLTASGDVIADGVSLINHKHSGVQSGGAQTGKPV